MPNDFAIFAIFCPILPMPRIPSLDPVSCLPIKKSADHFQLQSFAYWIPSGALLAAPKINNIRVAFIGVGARGTGHAKHIAKIEGTEIVAISDLYQDLVERSVKNCVDIGKGRHRNIVGYYGEENSWKKMLVEVNPDIDSK